MTTLIHSNTVVVCCRVVEEWCVQGQAHHIIQKIWIHPNSHNWCISHKCAWILLQVVILLMFYYQNAYIVNWYWAHGVCSANWPMSCKESALFLDLQDQIWCKWSDMKFIWISIEWSEQICYKCPRNQGNGVVSWLLIWLFLLSLANLQAIQIMSDFCMVKPVW